MGIQKQHLDCSYRVLEEDPWETPESYTCPGEVCSQADWRYLQEGHGVFGSGGVEDGENPDWEVELQI